jgi:hypothetical protein
MWKGRRRVYRCGLDRSCASDRRDSNQLRMIDISSHSVFSDSSILFIRRIVQIWYMRKGNAEGAIESWKLPKTKIIHEKYPWHRRESAERIAQETTQQGGGDQEEDQL